MDDPELLKCDFDLLQELCRHEIEWIQVSHGGYEALFKGMKISIAVLPSRTSTSACLTLYHGIEQCTIMEPPDAFTPGEKSFLRIATLGSFEGGTSQEELEIKGKIKNCFQLLFFRAKSCSRRQNTRQYAKDLKEKFLGMLKGGI